MEPETQRKAHKVPEFHAMVLKLGTNIEVAGAQFVESGDTLDEVQAIIRDNLRDTLPGKKIQTELGRKKLVVLVGIAAWLFSPELRAEHRIEI